MPIPQGTNATPVNPTNWNTLVDGINALGENVIQHGATGDGSTDDSAAFIAAIAAAAGGVVLVPEAATSFRLSANVTVPAGVTVVFQEGGLLLIDNAIAFTVNGGIQAGTYRIFSGAGTAVLAANPTINIVWYSASGTGDNSSRWVDALRNAFASNGNISHYYAPAGNYEDQSTITLDSTGFWTLSGDGMSVTRFHYDQIDDTSLMKVERDAGVNIVYNVVIRDMSFYGGSTATGAAIEIVDASQFWINNVTIEDFDADTVTNRGVWTKGRDNIKLSNVRFSGVITSIYIDDNANSTIDCDHFYLENVRMHAGDQDNGYGVHFVCQNVYNFTATGNNAIAHVKYGFYWDEGTQSLRSLNIAIRDFRIENGDSVNKDGWFAWIEHNDAINDLIFSNIRIGTSFNGFHIRDTDRLSINNVNSAGDAGYTALDIDTTVISSIFDHFSRASGATFTTTGLTASYLRGDNAQFGLELYGADSRHSFGLGPGAADDFIVGTNYIVVEGDTGNVGINTDDPDQLLEVSDSTTPYIRLVNTTEGTWDFDDIFSGIQFYNDDTTATGPNIAAAIEAIHTRSGSGHGGADAGLRFLTWDINDANPTERMRITSVGKTILHGSLVADSYNFAADAEASDTYVISLDPAPDGYVTGMLITFTANTANTGACTVNVNALGAKSLKVNHDRDPGNGYIESGSVVTAVYDGTNFQITSIDAGVPDYAGIFGDDNAVATTILLVDAYEPVTIFDTNMPEVVSNGDFSNNNITIGNTGDYKASVHLSGESAGNNKVYEFDVFEIAASGDTITGVTQANPGVVTATGHSFSNGNRVKIASVAGMTELNGQIYTVASAGANDFELNDDNGANINTTGYTAYTSGGTAFLATCVDVAHTHRQFGAGVGDIGSMSGGGIAALTSGNTLELHVKGVTDATNLTLESLQLSIIKL